MPIFCFFSKQRFIKSVVLKYLFLGIFFKVFLFKTYKPVFINLLYIGFSMIFFKFLFLSKSHIPKSIFCSCIAETIVILFLLFS